MLLALSSGLYNALRTKTCSAEAQQLCRCCSAPVFTDSSFCPSKLTITIACLEHGEPMARAFRSFHRASHLLILFYLVFITAAEAIITFGSPTIGLTVHALLIFGLTIHGGVGRNEAGRRLALGLVLLPLMRVLSLALPLEKLPQWAWIPVIAAPLLISVVLLVRQLHLGRHALGLSSRMPLIQFMLMGGGLGIGFAEYLLLQPTQFAATFAWNTVALATLVVLLSVGFLEEVIFRGLLQTLSLPVLGRWALVYGALLYAAMYIGFRSWPVLTFVFVLALVFACLVRWSGSAIGVAMAHGLANIMVFMVMPWAQQQTSPQIILVVHAPIAAGSTLAGLAVLFLVVQQVHARIMPPLPHRSAPERIDIRTLRRRAGLTYIDLAIRTGIPARQLAEIEFGDRVPTAEYRQRISQVFNVAL
jgi:membrane protease YdiL (CAAX protease family)